MKTKTIYSKFKGFLRYCMLISCLILGSCEDFITVDPPAGRLIKTTVFSDDLTAKAAVYGLYGKLGFGGGPLTGGTNGISLMAGLSSDELRLTTQSDELIQFNENSLISTNPRITLLWNGFYEYIYMCNSLIEGLNSSTGVTATLKEQLLGEALFIRAFVHFYLVNLFGKVPYVTTTDYEINTTIGRMEPSEVYSAIINDLTRAKELMSIEYPTNSGFRTRANSLAASALLSKAYLYSGNNAEAEIEAGLVIDNPQYELENINDVFLVSSIEAIWQLENSSFASYTNDGALFYNPEYTPAHITTKLIESFEENDLRFSNWILEFDYNGVSGYTPYKYKDGYESTTQNEYSTLIRLGEIYLIRAEARARLGKLDGANSALSDLNAIRDRAGLDLLSAMNEPQILDAILNERRHELFTEWGARWIDLKRSGKTDEVLGLIKSDWERTDDLYPIPYEETLVNQHLPQNDGYQ